jgi:probable rRNA maturation factor
VRARAGKAPIKKTTEIDLPTARTLSRFLKTAQEAVGLKGQVTVLLTTDEAIRGLNRRFRGKNKATDVLSFPAFSPGFGPAAERVAGDLAISVTTALRQANEQGHPLWTEIKVLILHGLLHLAGYDHETDDGRMARRELKLRAKLKLPQGLIERAASPTHSPKGRRMDGAQSVYQGLKPKTRLGAGLARLKSSPDTKPRPHGALLQTAKSGLDKKQTPRRFPGAGVDALTTAGLETGATELPAKPKAKRP